MGGVVVVPVEFRQFDAVSDVPRGHPRPRPVGVQLRTEDGHPARWETLHKKFHGILMLWYNLNVICCERSCHLSIIHGSVNNHKYLYQHHKPALTGLQINRKRC